MAEEGVDLELTDDISPLNDEISLVLQHSDSPETVKPHTGPLVQSLRISILRTEKKAVSSLTKQDVFVVYCIETRAVNDNEGSTVTAPTFVWRRYRDFELLRNYLEVTFPWVVLPVLPEKKATHTWTNTPVDRFHPGFIERRRCGLERFLLRCAAHSQVCQDDIFYHFIHQEYGWRDAVNATDFQSKAESRLKMIGAQLRLKTPDRRFEDLKIYSKELQSSIENILTIRARMCEKLYGVHKVHGNYARVLREWSQMENDWAQHLQNASHYMDIYSSSIDSHLDQTEQFAEDLKEYNAFAESLRSVCRRYECAQYDVDRTEESLASKHFLKQSMESGTASSGFSLSGMKSKLFGSDTPEQKEAKMKQLGEQILQVETELSQLQKQCILFSEEALKDVERFQAQKVQDLHQVFLNHAQLQVNHCKQEIAAWTGIRDSFNKI